MEVVVVIVSIIAIILILYPQQKIIAASSTGGYKMEEAEAEAAAVVNGINNNNNIIIGGIVDGTSRAGKEAKVAMEMALYDFNIKYNSSSSSSTNQTNLLLHFRDYSGTHPLQAAFAARELIETEQVKAIIGPHTWEETSLILDVSSKAQILTISLADSNPQWATDRWPFLVQASASSSHYYSTQIKAVAAIVDSWGWRRISVIIDEDLHSHSNQIIFSLQQIGAKISQLVSLPPLTAATFSSSLSKQLENLKTEQCRVFVVHASLPLSIRLFDKAKQMGMMEKGYVWITTTSTTDLVHSINPSAISTMQGVLGVKSYFQDQTSSTGRSQFNRIFRNKFRKEHPEEENSQPGIYAVQAYNAVTLTALAVTSSSRTKQMSEINVSNYFFPLEFDGLTGRVQYNEHRELVPGGMFQIVNVIGKSYRELGYWTEGIGFWESSSVVELEDDKAGDNSSSSMQILGQVFWPGGPWYTPRGWTIPTKSKPLIVGVPTESSFKQFVKVSYDSTANEFSYTGFSIEIFKETIKSLPYYLHYKFVPFNGTYNALVEQVYLKNFDAVAGDVAIIERRFKYAEFTQPYTEPGLVMVVPVQSQMSNKAWLFLKPFTKSMWALIVTTNIYNGFVVWFIERNHCPELKGPLFDQIGTLIWLSFATLFSLRGERLHSNLSRMATIMWLFMALVIVQSYTASLSSMLTVQKLEPTVADIDTLRSNNAIVGHSRPSFIAKYLQDVLGFKSDNLRNFTSAAGYAQAFKTGQISAAFIEASYAKLFLAKYCNTFTIAGPSYKVGGFGFVFPRGSPMLREITEALLNVSETGKLPELENKMIGAEKCVDVVESKYEYASLSLNNFWVLFMLTGGTSTVALAIYVIVGKAKLPHNSVLEHNNNKSIYTIIFAIIKLWELQRRRRLSGNSVSHAEVPTSTGRIIRV